MVTIQQELANHVILHAQHIAKVLYQLIVIHGNQI